MQRRASVLVRRVLVRPVLDEIRHQRQVAAAGRHVHARLSGLVGGTEQLRELPDQGVHLGFREGGPRHLEPDGGAVGQGLREGGRVAGGQRRQAHVRPHLDRCDARDAHGGYL